MPPTIFCIAGDAEYRTPLVTAFAQHPSYTIDIAILSCAPYRQIPDDAHVLAFHGDYFHWQKWPAVYQTLQALARGEYIHLLPNWHADSAALQDFANWRLQHTWYLKTDPTGKVLGGIRNSARENVLHFDYNMAAQMEIEQSRRSVEVARAQAPLNQPQPPTPSAPFNYLDY